MISDFFYKKVNGWKPPFSPTPPANPLTISSYSKDSGDEFLAWWRSCKTKRGEKVKVEARHHLRGSVKVWRKNNMKGSSYGEFSPICLFCTHNTSSWCENITWIKRKEERCFLIHVQTLSHSCDALWFIYLTYPYIR